MIEPSAEQNRVSREIVDAAFTVHSALGPGLLESAYEQCLVSELTKRGVSVERQVGLPIFYGGDRIEAGYRMDMLVGERIVVEVKAVELILPIPSGAATHLPETIRPPPGPSDQFQRDPHQGWYQALRPNLIATCVFPGV